MSIKLKDTIYDLINNADKIDGIDSTSLFRKLGSNVDINTFADGSNKNGIIYINTTTPDDINAPFSYGTILSFNSAAGSWMLGNSSAGTLKFRNRWWSESGAAWGDWKDIAFKADIPTSLKCPTSLTIQFNGTSQGAWDGSIAKTINITPAAIGASAEHNHPYLPLAGGTLTGNLVLEGNGDYRCIRVGKETGNNAVFHNSSYTGSSREASISWMNGTTTIGSIGVSTYPFFVNSSSNVYKIWHEGNDGSGSGLDADLLDDWHKNYFSIGYNGSRHYHLKFGEGAEDLAWKTIVKGSTSVVTAPSSNSYIAMTIRGTIWYCNGNHGQMETKMYPFCAVFQCVSAKTIINAAYLWLPSFAKSIDCIRIVRISTNSFELQVRQVASWQNGWIDYQILNSGMTVNAYETLQTAGSGTVVKTATDSSTISESAIPSHTHEYASTVKVGSTSYTSSSNVVSLPAYPTVPTSLKCPASLTIQLNGTSQGAWDGSSAKTINITPASIGASAASHSHSYLPLAGGTLTGNVTVYTGGNGTGLKFGSGTLNSLSNQLLWQSAEAIRFGSSSWDWNQWAGLKYNHSSKIIYLGIPDNVIFNANSAQSGGSIYTPGVSSIYIGNGSYIVLHSNNWSSYCAAASHNHDGSYFRKYVTGISSSNIDTFDSNRVCGAYSVSYSGYSGTLLSFKTGQGSVSAIEIFAPTYEFATGGLKARIAIDNNRHTAWRTFSFSDHTHSYIPLSGGTLSSGTSRISRAGSSVSWYQGRSNAMMYISSYSGYNAIASMKTTNGDWSLGVYSNNYLYFTYVTDTNYNSGTNTTTAQMIFRPDGYIVGNLSGYATSAGNADTCDSHHFSTVSSLPASPNASTVYFIV